MPINAFMTDRPTTTVMADGGVGRKKRTGPEIERSLAKGGDAGVKPAEEPVSAQRGNSTPAVAQPVKETAAKPAVQAAQAISETASESEGLSPYEARELASYRAQEDAVNRLYEAKRRSQLAGLKSAYEQSLADYKNAREDIAPVFEAQRNATAAESERQRAAFNEYAAARGLNSGAGGQAELARGSVLAGNLNALNVEQARRETEIDRAIAALKAQYQSSVAQAAADSDYQRLADLLSEYRQQEASLVSTSANQADEDYRAWQSAYKTYRDEAADELSAAKAAATAARKSSSGSAKKAASGAAKAGDGASGATLIEEMLAMDSDAEAYTHLLSKGYRAGDTETLWDLFRREKAQREKAAKEAAQEESVPERIVYTSATGDAVYDDAVNEARKKGVADEPLTRREWQSWRSSYLQGGRGDPEARYGTYEEYMNVWRSYIRSL